MAKDQKSNEAKPVINDLIFKELIKRGYSLEGKTRVWNIADSKLWYLTPDQAQAFLDLEKDKEYQKDIIEKEMMLINENINTILEMMNSNKINLIDLGCGDGKKAVIFLKKLKTKGAKDTKVRYCPIDISGYMVEKALNKVAEAGVDEIVKFQWNISDFENIENIASLLRTGEYKKNLMLLLGNTLGNFEINELLYEVRSAMGEGDVLVIGNGLDNRNAQEILKAYDSPHLDKLLIKTVTQLGIPHDKLKYGVRFANSRVEMYYTIMEGCKISFLGREVPFDKGDQILVAVSYKYAADDFKAFLKMYFGKSEIFVSKDKSYALALCKK
ncbi:MAG: L-histidine N(alpha)-methyltransferase [archaeon]